MSRRDRLLVVILLIQILYNLTMIVMAIWMLLAIVYIAISILLEWDDFPTWVDWSLIAFLITFTEMGIRSLKRSISLVKNTYWKD